MCGPIDCGRMLDVLKLEAKPDCDDACQNQIKDYFRKIPTQQLNASTALIIDRLLTGSTKLDEDDKVLASRLNQLKPDYDAAIAELKSVRDKQEKLDSLLSTSVSALDAWAEAHANLRVAVNTNQQLTVAKLASKVREIWGIDDGYADE